MFCRAALVALVTVGACAPKEEYSGRARVVLEWEDHIVSGTAEAIAYKRHERDFAIETTWQDENLGPIVVGLSREGDAVGREVVVAGKPCLVRSGGLVLDGLKVPYPITFNGSCRRGDDDVSFRFAFVPDKPAAPER